jgi:hypothetical protein
MAFLPVSNSNSAIEFFSKHGIKISKDSSHNVLILEDAAGHKLEIWTECFRTVADGIPGLYVSGESSDLLADRVDNREPVYN